ncbi:hypothetical protein KCP73_15395 [Salmonella enterica subsp. enterica]|nr:hypothetical protein KCP73_15395 [Salmonella enterica subsp. enterica]
MRRRSKELNEPECLSIYRPARVDPPKKPLNIRKIEFVERTVSEGQAKARADRCLSCGNPYCERKCPAHKSAIPNRSKPANEGVFLRVGAIAPDQHPAGSVAAFARRTACEGSCTLHR